MRSRNACHQNDREHYDVFFTEPEEVSRPGQCAFQQTPVTQMVRFPGRFGLKPIMLDHRLDGQPARLIRQGRRESWGT